MAKLTKEDHEMIRRTALSVVDGFLVGVTEIDGAVGPTEIGCVTMPITSTKQRVSVTIRVCGTGDYPEPG